MIASGQVPAVWKTTPVTNQVSTTTPEPNTTLATPTPTPTAPTPDKTAEIQAQNQAKLIENQQQAQLKEQERQKIAQETAQANTPTNQQGILNAFIAWQPPAVQNTQAYRNAQFQYNQFSRFNAMTPTQLLDNLKQGQIGTEMDKLLSQNPSYIQAKQELDNIQKIDRLNSNAQTYINWLNWTPTEPVDALQALSDKITASLGLSDQTYADAFAQHVTNDPKIVDYTTQLSNVNKQIADQTNLINEGIKQVKQEKGDMPTASLLTYMASRFSEANDYLTTLNNTKTYLEADLKNATEMAKSNYDAVSKDIDNALNQRNAVISNLIQQQFSLAGKEAEMQMEADMNKKIAEEALNDPATAISNVMATYAEMGIPFVQSIQTKVADAENFIAQGGTLSGYLDKMIKDIQAKPEYKAMSAYQMSQYTPKSTTPYELKELGGKTYKFNQETGQYEIISPIDIGTGWDLRYLADQFPNQAWAKNNNPAGITWNANFDKWTGTAKLLADAGIQFAKWTPRPANEGGNYVTFATIEDGLKAQQIIMSQTYGNSTVGQMLASWVGTGEWANYAKQVSEMAGIDQNVKVSSLTPEQLSTLQMAKIKKESPGLYGILSQGTSTTGTQVSSEAQSWVNAWNNGTMDIETILTKIGTSKEAMPLKNEVIKAIDAQGGVAWRKDNDPAVTKLDDIISKLDSASKSSYLNTIAGTVQTSLSNFLTGGKSDLLSDLKTVIEWGTLQSLIDAKAQGATFGALSNEELKMLQATSSSIAANAIRDPDTKEIIGFKMSEAKLKSELQKMKALFEEKKARMTGAGLKSTSTLQTQPTQNNTGAGQVNTWTGQTYSYGGKTYTFSY